MVKILLILCLFGTVSLLKGEGGLRIADASRSGIGALKGAGLELAVESGTAVFIDRVSPDEARKRLESGRADLIVLEQGNLPEKRPAVCKLFAAEALAVYVHRSNPLRGVSRKELKEILTDKRPCWSSFYPPLKTDIHRYSLTEKAQGSRLAESLLEVEQLASEIFRVGSTREILLLAGNDTDALGIGLLVPDLPPEVKPLAINGSEPVPAAVASGRYLLSWRYYILGKGKLSGPAEKFLRKMKQASFVRELESFGFIAF